MPSTIKAYGDGRLWDDNQRRRVNDILNQLRDDLDIDDLRRIRKDTEWLFDVVFPTGFSYTANKFPSEEVTGGYMEGNPNG